MYTAIECGVEFDLLNSKCKDLAHQLLGRAKCEAAGVVLPAGSRFGDRESGLNELYVLKEGNIPYVCKESRIFFYEEGDIIGLEDVSALTNSRITTELAVTVDIYWRESLWQQIAASPVLRELWDRYLASSFARLYAVLEKCTCSGEPGLPQLRPVRAGSTIIRQGDEGDEVFTLIEGAAEAFVNGLKVGDILVDEIFGALAPLTGTKRTASVVAKQDCVVLALPKADLLKLIQFRPKTVQKLVEDMARALVSLNELVVQLKGPSAASL